MRIHHKKSSRNALIRLWDEGRGWKEYREALGRKDRGRGIYVLYKKGRVYYIGLSTSSMRSRLRSHATRDRHAGKWDTFSLYQVRRGKYIKDIESLLLRVFHPKGNRVSGRFHRKYNVTRRRK
jgi:hypothetical protein